MDRWQIVLLVAAVAVAAVAGSGVALTAEPPATQPATAPTEAKIHVSVDERVELMSIIFRLAGNPEYCRGRVKAYAADVDKHFLPFKDHAAVKLARSLRSSRGVSYDAPMSLAIHVTGAAELGERVPFDPHPPGLDRRWQLGQTRRFLRVARRFAAETKFDRFFRDHRWLYETAEARMRETLARHARLEWFDRFFGQRPGADFRIVLGMLNGVNCYGGTIHCAGREEMYCILGVWATDAKSEPVFGKGVMPVVIHEFCHSYCNPLVDKHAAELAPAGRALYARVGKRMRSMAYGNWQAMMYESLVRACVVRYRTVNEGTLAGLGEAVEQRLLGFAWVGGLSQLLAEYEAKRQTYPTLAAFMPRVVRWFEWYVASLPAKAATRPAGPPTRPSGP